MNFRAFQNSLDYKFSTCIIKDIYILFAVALGFRLYVNVTTKNGRIMRVKKSYFFFCCGNSLGQVLENKN